LQKAIQKAINLFYYISRTHTQPNVLAELKSIAYAIVQTKKDDDADVFEFIGHRVSSATE
jgi:hypothetical protein